MNSYQSFPWKQESFMTLRIFGVCCVVIQCTAWCDAWTVATGLGTLLPIGRTFSVSFHWPHVPHPRSLTQDLSLSMLVFQIIFFRLLFPLRNSSQLLMCAVRTVSLKQKDVLFLGSQVAQKRLFTCQASSTMQHRWGSLDLSPAPEQISLAVWGGRRGTGTGVGCTDTVGKCIKL